MEDKEQTRVLALLALALASLVCFATAADFMNNETFSEVNAQTGWGVACGVISFVVVLLYFGLLKVMEDLAHQVAPIVGGFLVIWWAFGIGFLTGSSGESFSYTCPPSDRHSIFAETNNGYFATLAFISSLYFMYLSVDQIQYTPEGRDYVNGLMAVSIASIIEFCAAADQPGSHEWAIACGIIAFAVAFIQMVLRSYMPEMSHKTAPVVGIFLVIWWTFGVGFITSSHGPFYNTCCERANGYLSSWVAYLGSIYYCFKTLLDRDQMDHIVLEDGERQGLGQGVVPPPQQHHEERVILTE